jgi:RHH-type rel operon transcriptional repressor/antitoxin RelB
MHVSARIPEKMGHKIEDIAEKTGRTKSYYVRKALEKFIEDQEDYLIAVQRLKENNPTYTLEDVIKELGLDNKNRRKSKKRA